MPNRVRFPLWIRNATDLDQTIMQKAVDNSWASPGSVPGEYCGNQLRSAAGGKAIRSWATRLSASALLLFSACQGPVLELDPFGPDPWRARIAAAYGIEVWPRIDTIQFTCQRYFPTPDGPRLMSERSWIHMPREAWTWLILPGDLLAEPFPAWPLAHLPGETAPQVDDPFSALREQFLEDGEWLFLPYTLAVDSGLNLRDQGLTQAPLVDQVARRIDVARSLPGKDKPKPSNRSDPLANAEVSDELLVDAAGNTIDPEQADLELFLSESDWILAARWGPGPDRQATTWSEPWLAGGLGFSLKHTLPDGSWIEYTNIHVRLE